jgi:hypothetical protein
VHKNVTITLGTLDVDEQMSHLYNKYNNTIQYNTINNLNLKSNIYLNIQLVN